MYFLVCHHVCYRQSSVYHRCSVFLIKLKAFMFSSRWVLIQTWTWTGFSILLSLVHFCSIHISPLCRLLPRAATFSNSVSPTGDQWRCILNTRRDKKEMPKLSEQKERFWQWWTQIGKIRKWKGFFVYLKKKKKISFPSVKFLAVEDFPVFVSSKLKAFMYSFR